MVRESIGVVSERRGYTNGDCIDSGVGSPTTRMAYNGNRPILIGSIGMYLAGRGGSVTGRMFIGTDDRRSTVNITVPEGTQANSTGVVNSTDAYFSDTPQSMRYGFEGASREFYFARGGAGTASSCDGSRQWDGKLFFAYNWSQVPTAPGLTSVTPGSTSAQIRFRAPSDDGGTALRGYTIQGATNSSFTLGVVSYAVSGSGTHTVTGLTPGTRYYWRVMAKNLVTDGVGILGGAASRTLSGQQIEVPSAPTLVSVTPLPGGDQVDLVYTAPTYNGGSGVREYIVYMERDGYPTRTFTTGSLTPRIREMVPGARYTFTVRAVNAAGASLPSNAIVATMFLPSVSVGDYFDGSFPDSDETAFSWVGTAHASQSIATAVGVFNWNDFIPGAVTSGGTGAVTSVSTAIGNGPLSGDAYGGISGEGGPAIGRINPLGKRAVQVSFFSDQDAPGFFIGPGTEDGFINGYATVPDVAPIIGSIYVTSSRAKAMAAQLFYREAGTSGAILGKTLGDPVWVPANTPTRLVVRGETPAGGVRATVKATDVGPTAEFPVWRPWLSGEKIVLDGAMVSLGHVLYPYFDGSFFDTFSYQYEWDGPEHNSSSFRTSGPVLSPYSGLGDPLLDPDCPPFPEPPRPPVVDASCIDDVDQWRRYWMQIPADNVPDWQELLPTWVMTTVDAVRQVRIRVYQNPFEREWEQIETSDYCSEQIISYIPPNTTMTIDAVLGRVYAEVNGGPSVAADHLLYGTAGVPATWPALSCGISHLVSIDVPSALAYGSVDTKVLLTRKVR